LLFSVTARRYDVHQCNFTDNSGRLVGGVISLTRESDINLFYLTEARIKNGTSILGGCLASGGSVRMTIANSTIAGCTALKGGALAVEGELGKANLWMAGTDIQFSNAQTGGGLYVSTLTELKLINVTLANNQAQYDGGGIRLEQIVSKVTCRGGNFNRNSAGGDGGAMSFNSVSSVNITGGKFTMNEATDGGAIKVGANTEMKCETSSFSQNKASEEGGGISSTSRAVTRVERCDMVLNSADKGGAIHVTGFASINGLNFTRNNATTDAGGIYIISTSRVSLDLFSFCVDRWMNR